MTKNDKDGQTTENMYEKKTWNLEMSSICLALAALVFTRSFFSQKKGHLGHLACIYYYDIFHVSTSENQSKIKPGFCQMDPNGNSPSKRLPGFLGMPSYMPFSPHTFPVLSFPSPG